MTHLVRGRLSKCFVPAIGLFFLLRTFGVGQDRPAAASFRSAFEARYPKSDTSAAALEIERLAAAIGVEMASYEPATAEDEKRQRETGKPIPFTLKAVKERPSVSPESARSFQQIYWKASQFLDRELKVPEDRIGAPPPELERFLAQNEDAIAAIESLLIREPDIRWELDVRNYPTGPVPNLMGFLRLQRLFAARALVKAKAGETDAALRTLDAAWRFDEVLSSRPELISQLIVVAAAKVQIGALRKIDSPAYGWADRLRSRRFFSAFLTAFQSEAWADPEVSDLTGEAGTYGRILQEIAGEIYDRDICSWTADGLRKAWKRAVRDQSRSDVPVADVAMPTLLESVDRWRRFLVDAELTALVLDARAERAASRRGDWPTRLNGIGQGVCPREPWTYRASNDGTATFTFGGRITDTAAPGVKLALEFTAGTPSAAAPRARPLDLYVAEKMSRAGVPGVAVVIVQNEKTVYAKGFGVRELGKPDPVTPDTLMMIGSIGNMTTTMMATLVDDGKIGWDTPVVNVYPEFRVSDPALTPRVTFRDTVCNCSGLQRHDLEIYFASRHATAEETVSSIRRFPFVGEFRKTFGYVNHVVGAGGYMAAWSARDAGDGLYENYVAQMQKRVFDPIGMTSTTFSFDRALANPNHAVPHGQTASGDSVRIPLDLEKSLTSLAPAGALWSTATDSARFLITQLNRGVSPVGNRVVSAENLEVTWQPQVEMQSGASYGLGWVVTTYKGQRFLTHGGGTSGFTADFSFLPDANLGVAILANTQNASALTASVRWRAIEIALDQPTEMDAKATARLEAARQRLRDKASRASSVIRSSVAPYLGSYANAALGRVELAFRDGRLTLTAMTFTSELKSLGGDTYLVWSPPLAGASIRFRRGDNGEPSFIFDADDPDISEKYTFQRETRP